MKKVSRKTFLEFDKNSKETYELISKKFAGAGKAPTNLDLFIFAMCYGFRNGNKVDSIQKSGTGVRVEYLKPADELLMAAIQFAESGKTESLLDQEERYEIAEKYAEGGIRLLKDLSEQQGDFLQDISGHVIQEFQAINSPG